MNSPFFLFERIYRLSSGMGLCKFSQGGACRLASGGHGHLSWWECFKCIGFRPANCSQRPVLVAGPEPCRRAHVTSLPSDVFEMLSSRQMNRILPMRPLPAPRIGVSRGATHSRPAPPAQQSFGAVRFSAAPTRQIIYVVSAPTPGELQGRKLWIRKN